jgi:hypothetical protein
LQFVTFEINSSEAGLLSVSGIASACAVVASDGSPAFTYFLNSSRRSLVSADQTCRAAMENVAPLWDFIKDKVSLFGNVRAGVRQLWSV